MESWQAEKVEIGRSENLPTQSQKFAFPVLYYFIYFQETDIYSFIFKKGLYLGHLPFLFHKFLKFQKSGVWRSSAAFPTRGILIPPKTSNGNQGGPDKVFQPFLIPNCGIV